MTIPTMTPPAGRRAGVKIDHKKLRELREARGLSQGQLAQRAAISENYAAKLEREPPAGRNPRMPVLIVICAALNCNPEDLIIE